MQYEAECYFFIADYHSLTTHPTPTDLQGNVRSVLIDFLASGLDPEKAILYVQSDLPEVAELYLLLNMNAYLGELERVASFKEKVRTQPGNVNAGLLTYPTLMAADVLVHKAAKVPVGKDQEQHLEMIRSFANRFNRLYHTEVFPIPVAYNFGENLVKIPGLDGSTKMSKSESEANAIYLCDSPKEIRHKIMRAVTDSGPTTPGQPKPQPVENLFSLLRIMSDRSTVDYFEEQYEKCTIRYGDLKKQLAEDTIRFTAPFREKINDLEKNPDYLHKVVVEGMQKARTSATRTIAEVRKTIGFKYL